MKAAWSNLVVGIADDNADMDVLLNDFVESVGTVAENIIPRVEKILAGLGELVTRLAPIVAEEIPRLVTTVLPSLLDAGISMLAGIADGIISALPSLLETALDVVLTLADGITENLPEIIPSAISIIMQIVETLIENLDELILAAVELIVALAGGLVDNIPTLLQAVPQMVEGIVKAFSDLMPQIVEIGGNIISGIYQGIKDSIANVGSWIEENVFQPFVGGFESIFGINSPSTVMAEMGRYLMEGLHEGNQASLNEVISFISGDFLTAWNQAWEGVKQSLASCWDGINAVLQNEIGSSREMVTAAVKTLLDGINAEFEAFFAALNARFELEFENLGMTLETKLALYDSMWEEWQKNFLAGWASFDSNFQKLWSAFWGSLGITFAQRWNGILTSLQQAINNAVQALNVLVKEANRLARFTGIRYAPVSAISVKKIEIPALAAGAVIPPNREFMAVLGDQKSGTNIEAPLDTIVQAVMMALSKSGGGQVIENVVTLDGEVIYRNQQKVSRRHGPSLVNR